MDWVTHMVQVYAGQLLLALVVLIAGLVIIQRFSVFLEGRMDRSGMDPSLKSFLVPLVRISLKVMLVISVASMVGIAMTSFIAVLGAAGLAVGFALQGSLANFAGGVLILILKPFRVGDYVETAGYAGTVKEIQVFHTLLDTPDRRQIIIPNAIVSNTSTVNYSVYETRRLDLTFGVGYQNDLTKVKQILETMAREHPRVMEGPAPMVLVGEHGDHAVMVFFRVWCQTADYWPLYFEFMEAVKNRFDEEGIQIPYPQMDVHLKQS